MRTDGIPLYESTIPRRTRVLKGVLSGDLGDAWLVRRLQAGQAAGAAEAYAGLDIGRVARLDRRMEMTLDSQAALDRQAGTDFAGLIERHFRTERMFRTPYHAEARIMRHMLALVMRHTGAPQDAWTGAENLLQASLFGAKDLPVHPGVAAHFGLRWTGPQTETRFFSETYLSFTGWADRFLRCEAYPAVSHAVQAVLQRHPAGPDLLQAAAPSLPDSPLVRYAQAIVSMRAGMADQALPMLLALESARPDLPHVNATLFEAYKNCGQPHEAEAALRREIASTPHIRGLYRQLLDVLVAQGRQTEAATLRRTMAMLGRGKPATANEVALS